MLRQAVVALIIKDGLILSIARKEDKTKFGLIGGKVDEGETLQEALIRETKEETSLIVTKSQFIYSRVEPALQPGGEDFSTHTYVAVEWLGTPTALENAEVKWLTAQELCDNMAGFPRYNRDMLDRFKMVKPLLQIMYPNAKLFIKGE